MELVTSEEIAILKKNPDTAALGEKLEKEASKAIPRSVFNEVNEEAKKLKAELDKITNDRTEADKKAMAEQGKWKELAEQRQKEVEDSKKVLEAEKSIAERYRKMESDKRAELKEKLGDKYLSIYDSAPMEDLVKLESSILPKDSPDGHRPGSKTEKVVFSNLTPVEREKMIQDAKNGTLKL
jgi:hypothetical protein